jgi:deoxycytidine triphosphate deaminase
MNNINQPLSPFAQTDKEALERFDKYKSKDPFLEIAPALLNSADIYDYVAATGMVYPFDAGKLKSASYSVPILGKVVYWNEHNEKIVEDIKRGEEFVLRPNSIAFVTIEPMLRIPDYIAFRFNLKITNVYRGILLGTGPLVDPGFIGKLSIPLHNLTTNNYTFVGGDDLIWIEFTKRMSEKSKLC